MMIKKKVLKSQKKIYKKNLKHCSTASRIYAISRLIENTNIVYSGLGLSL